MKKDEHSFVINFGNRETDWIKISTSMNALASIDLFQKLPIKTNALTLFTDYFQTKLKLKDLSKQSIYHLTQ